MRTWILGLTIPLIITSSGCSSAPGSTGSIQPAPAITATATELREDMRELWTDHVVWTRMYIVAAVDGHQGAQAALDRLMKNQEDLGNAIVPYYGAPAGTRLTTLLKEHISIAGEVVAAARADDKAKLSDADHRWHQNATDIAAFLSGANPNWTQSALKSMLDEHLALTTRETVARLQGNWSEEVAIYDRVFHQAMMMADALADGISRQFNLTT